MCICEEKTTFLGKYDLTILELGEGDYGTWSHDTKPYYYFAAHFAFQHYLKTNRSVKSSSNVS